MLLLGVGQHVAGGQASLVPATMSFRQGYRMGWRPEHRDHRTAMKARSAPRSTMPMISR